MKTLTVICSYCNKKVYRSPSSKSKYCSRECYGASMKGVIKTPNKYCNFCGKKIIGHQKHKANTKYCSSKCYGLAKRKPFIIKKGYKKILIMDHPRSDTKGYVFEHILIIEAEIGRSLKDKEEVHHKDFNKLNNEPSNLIVCKDHSSHMNYHSTNSK